MKIDNDFLTLLDLTLRLHHLDRIEDELAGYDIEGVMPLMVKIGELCGKRKDLVAKINAADDADAAIEKQTADLTEAAKKTNDALAKLLKTMVAMVEAKDADAIRARITEASRAIGQAMAAKDMDKAEALKAEVAALKKKLASMVEAKDAAPAPSQPKGHQVSVRTVTDAVEFVDRYGKPDSITIEHDPMTWIGGIVFVLRWNVSPKDADGEGR